MDQLYCPRASFCGSGGKTLPNWVSKNHTYQTQLEIPINNLTKNDFKKRNYNSSRVIEQWNNEDAEDWWLLGEFQEDERKKALIHEITKRKIENIYKTLENEAKNKISFSIAIAMAFSFFVSGFVFSAALWIIYFRTDPRRKIRNVETTGIRPRNVTVLRPVYEPHQQYSQNYMTASSLLGSQ
uniref:Uncharacterized protein n=1 Tax=Syphacia muris TaxID=451379 RepID=A0A0N5AR67_9BILA